MVFAYFFMTAVSGLCTVETALNFIVHPTCYSDNKGILCFLFCVVSNGFWMCPKVSQGFSLPFSVAAYLGQDQPLVAENKSSVTSPRPKLGMNAPAFTFFPLIRRRNTIVESLFRSTDGQAWVWCSMSVPPRVIAGPTSELPTIIIIRGNKDENTFYESHQSAMFY